MINEQEGVNNEQQIDDQTLSRAVNDTLTSGLRLAYQLTPEEQSIADGNGDPNEPTPDEVWEFFAANPDKSFDKSTPEGLRLYELFRIANKERHGFTMDMVKEMANVVAKVPAEIVSGLVRSPLKAPMSAVDGMARDIRDLYGILAQSEDPDSPLFRFKSYIMGKGSIEEQIDQINEARWHGMRSRDLEEGRATVLEDWVPPDYKNFVKNLIDPKLANALSYIGLETPHILLSPLRNSGKRALIASKAAYKEGGILRKIAQEEAESLASEGIGSITRTFRDHYDNTSKRMREYAMRVTGTTLAGTADVVAKPFSYVQQKIAQGSAAVAETAGSNATALRNAAQTAVADAGERVVGEGLALSPIRSTLFSLGVKPLTEYASVLGNEIVDYANGVVQVKPQHTGMGMLERLAQKNGSKVPMSAEALAVAKFTNVVVGWPASMAVPVLKRAVGDAAYMGVLGYLNSRGEGAASGMGIGFAWGGLSGSLRHVHNVYSQNVGHRNVIDNFDKAQINTIEAKNPDNAKHIRETLRRIDLLKDDRISATIRAILSQGFVIDPEAGYRFGTKQDLIKEFGPDKRIMDLPSNGMGATIPSLQKNGAKMNVVFINSNGASPETIAHEIAHQHLNAVFRNDADSIELVKMFFGDSKDAGVMSDDAMAHLHADYYSKFDEESDAQMFAGKTQDEIRKIKYDFNYKSMKSTLDTMRKEQLTNPSLFDIPSKASDGSMRAEQLVQNPILGDLVQEVFAHSYSNSILNKSADFFMRSPEQRSIRASVENLFMLRTQRLVSKIEEAGILMRPTDPTNPNTRYSTFMWEDGRYLHMPLLDTWTSKVMSMAMRHGDVNVSLMSPERAEAYFKQTGKERFADTVKGGKVMKGKAEVDEIITSNTEKIVDALESLPQNERPRFNVTQEGNKFIDVTTLNQKHWESIIKSNVFNKSEIEDLRGLSEVVRNTRAGKPVFNTFIAQYLGRTHQVVIDGMVRRLTGKDVPVTNRHFSPYAIELRYDKFDEYGNPLKKPKGHITVHCVDVRVLNKRRLKMWQRPDVRALFTDFGHYTRTFTDYMHNLSQDASNRKTSVERFKPEFGENAEAVRDVMYETFGGRKRMDESFINAPKSGYTGNADGPNYPFHSLRFELLANIQKQTSVFQETFGTNLGNLPYNHANAYEGVRRNLMVGGFVEYPVGEDRSYWSNHVGYEIRQGTGDKLSLFSPFGNLIGNFKTLAKAQSYAERHMRSIPAEEGRGFVGTESGPKPDTDLDVNVSHHDVTSQRVNMMVGNNGYYHAEVKLEDNPLWDDFIIRAVNDRISSDEHRNENDFYQQASIKLSDILKDQKLLKDHPWIGDFKIIATDMSALHGGYIEGEFAGRNNSIILGLPKAFIRGSDSKGMEKSLKAILQGLIQDKISFAEGHIPANVYPFVDGDTRYVGGVAMMSQLKDVSGYLDEMKKSDPSATLADALKQMTDSNLAKTLQDFWGYDDSKKRSRKVEDAFGAANFNRAGKTNGVGLTKQEHSLVANHFSSILDSFSGKSPNSFIVQSMGSTTLFINPRLLEISPDLGRVLAKQDPRSPNLTFRDRYNQLMTDSLSGFHHVSKLSRDTKGNQALHFNEISSNIDAVSEGKVDNVVQVKNGYFTGNPNVSRQTYLSIQGIEDFAIVTIGRTTDSYEPNKSRDGSLTANTNTTFITPTTSFTSLSQVALGSTTETLAIKKLVPVMRSGATGQGFNVSINALMAFNGISPYLFGSSAGVSQHGRLYSHVKNGTFSDIFDAMYMKAFPEKHAQLMANSGGNNPFRDYHTVKRIASDILNQGISGPEELAVFQYATALTQIILGEEMIAGSELGKNATQIISNDINRVNLTSHDSFKLDRNTRLGQMNYYNPEYVGACSVNEGVSRIMLIAERMDMGVVYDKNSLSSRFVSSFDDGGSNKDIRDRAAKFQRDMSVFGDKLKQTLKLAGYDKESKISPVSVHKGSNMMVGGFFSAKNATETMMEAAGMLRFVRTDNGITYKAFEFSDKGARLNTSAVDDKIHLLPFINDLESPSKGYEKFISEYTKAASENNTVEIGNIIRKIPTIRLGDILEHDLLYRFYPDMKEIRVGFTEGFGAAYYPRRNMMSVGIERLISGEIAKANGVNSDAIVIPDSMRVSSVLTSLIHEAQHAIQRLETWNQTTDISESAQYKRGIFKYLLRNMLGLNGAFYGPIRESMSSASGLADELAKAKELGIADSDVSKILELTPEEMEKHLCELADSPLAQRINHIAVPTARELLFSDALAFERVSYELTSNRKISEKLARYSRDFLDLQAEVTSIDEMLNLKSINENQAHALLFGENGILERREQILHEMEKTTSRDVYTLVYEYVSHHDRYRELIMDVSRITTSIKHDASHGTLYNSHRIRNLVQSLGLMQYYGQFAEQQAYDVAERIGMTQDELNSKKSSSRKSEIIDVGFRGKNTLRELGVMLRRGEVPRVHNMIGGLGKGVNIVEGQVGNDFALTALQAIARMSTISYYISSANRELRNLGRHIVTAKGWEVINGKARLVFKSGIIESPEFAKANPEKEIDVQRRYRSRSPMSPIKSTLHEGSNSFVHIFNGLSEDKTNSISMEEVARLIDGTILMENEIVTPTEAIDAVYRQEFPDRVNVDELRSILTGMGVSEEAINLANVSAIQTAFAGSNLSKEEIVNIMAVNHQFIISEIAMGTAFGKSRIADAVTKSNPDFPKFLNAVKKRFGNNYQSFVKNSFEQIGVPVAPWHDVVSDSTVPNYGLFKSKKGKIVFEPRKPDFIPDELWNNWVQKKKESGTWPKDKKYIHIGRDELHRVSEVYQSNDAVDLQVEKLNQMYALRCMRLEPYFRAFMSNIQRLDPELQYSLIDDAILLSTRYEPESSAMYRQDEFGVRSMYVEEMGNQLQRDAFNEILGPYDQTEESKSTSLGPNIILSEALRSSLAPDPTAKIGSIHYLLPTVSHTFTSSISNSWGPAFETGIPYPIQGAVRDSMGKITYPELESAGVRHNLDQPIVTPYGTVYNSDNAVSNDTRKAADSVLRGVDRAHIGMMRIIGTIISTYEQNLKAQAGSSRTPESVKLQLHENIEKILPVIRGLHNTMSIVSDSFTNRNSLLVPFASRQLYVTGADTLRKLHQTALQSSRSYLGTDGSIVVESVNENVFNGSTSHNDVMEASYLLPSSGGGLEDVSSALKRLQVVVQSGLVGELERAVLVNGDVGMTDGSELIKSGDVHQILGKLIGIGSGMLPSEINLDPIALRSKSEPIYSGIHALHSCLYQLCVSKGLTGVQIASIFQNSPELTALFMKTDLHDTGLVSPTSNGGYVSSDLYAVASAPVLSKAFSRSCVFFDGNGLKKRDILDEVQRAKFDELISETDTLTHSSDGHLNKIREFLSSLSMKQREYICEMCSDANSNTLLESTIAGIQGMGAIEAIGTYPAMEAVIPNFKEEMRSQMRQYIRTGAFQWEQGVGAEIPNVVLRKSSEHEKPFAAGIYHILRSDRPLNFSKFLLAIKSLNQLPAYKLERVSGKYGVAPISTQHSSYASANFKMSSVTGTQSWSTIELRDTGAFDRMIVTSDFNRIERKHSIKDPSNIENNKPIGFGATKLEGIGFGDMLLMPIQYFGTEEVITSNGGQELVGGKSVIPRKAASVSKPFARKLMVNSLMKEAKRVGSSKISIQPARASTIGRKLITKSQIIAASRSGQEGVKGVLYDIGIRSIPSLGSYDLMSRGVIGASPSSGSHDKFSEVSNFGEKGSLGFAFKRLEDGRLAINISGDVLGYKNFSSLTTRGGWQDFSVGLNLEESLGYSHHDGSLSHFDPKFFTGRLIHGDGPKVDNQISRMMNVHGRSWRVEAIKKANQIINKGVHELRGVNDKLIGTSASRASQSQMDAFIRILEGTANPDNVIDVSMAMALLRDSSTDNFLTITIPANATPEQIRASILTLFLEREGSVKTFSYLGFRPDNYSVDFNRAISFLNSSRSNPDGATMQTVMGEGLIVGEGKIESNSGNIHKIMESYVLKSSESGSSSRRTSTLRNNMPDNRRLVDILAMSMPHLIPDIERVASMALKQDHGYYLPDLERGLALNGDRRSVIEMMFPNRPELTQFAWDNSDNSNVSIVPRREGKKIVSYLVGYDIPSGIDKEGKLVKSRKVTSVRTLSEAEALRDKFTISSSKAELALAIDSISNQTGKFAVNNTGVVKSPNAPIRRNVAPTLERVADGYELNYRNSDTYTVGDLDLRVTKQQAEQIQAQISTPDVLQADIIEPRVNMMVGKTGSDAKELESLLRRKISFGTGMGRIEFMSRLMNVIAHGKTRNGKNKYPELMTGAEWFKFLRENSVSKDEIRMSGIAYLLSDNEKFQISRSELAEFVYTMYPRNIRQDKGGVLADPNHISVVSKGIDSMKENSFIYPFIFDVEGKEQQVVNAHSANIDRIQKFIEEFSNSEDESKRKKASVVDFAINEAIKELIDVTGLPSEINSMSTTSEKLEYIRKLALEGLSNTEMPEQYVAGSHRRIKPSQLDLIVKAAAESKLEELNGVAENALPDIGLVDPWNWSFANVGHKFDDYEINSEGRFVYGPTNSGIIGTPEFAAPKDRNLVQQGVLLGRESAHEGYASYHGGYTSSIWLTELWSERMQKEHDRFVSILKERLNNATNHGHTEDARRIQSIITNAERVKAMRVAFNELRGGRMGNAGHYGTPLQGMFQLGHIRTTAGISLASHGASTLGRGIQAIDESDPILGIKREVEPTFHVEEIQSDTFQYKSFGPSGQIQYTLPDSIEQAVAMRDVSELNLIRSRKSEIRKQCESAEENLKQIVSRFRRVSDVASKEFNALFAKKYLESIGPVERHLIYRDLIEASYTDTEEHERILRPDGGSYKLNQEYAEHLGSDSIPTYSWNLEHDKTGILAIRMAIMRSTVPALYELNLGKLGIVDLEDYSRALTDFGESNTNVRMTIPLLILQFANMDEVAHMSASEIKRAVLNDDVPNFDFNAMADRLIDRMERAVKAHESKDTAFNYNEYSTRHSKNRTLRLLIDVLKDLRSSDRQTIQNFTGTIGTERQTSERLSRVLEKSANSSNIRFYDFETMSHDSSGEDDVAGVKQARIPPKEVSHRMTMGHTVVYRFVSDMATNGLSQFLLDNMNLFAIQADMGDALGELSKLESREKEILKKLPVDSDAGNVPEIINSQPYGVEDIYRPISLHGTVLRAANAGFRQIGMTDARHHFKRGHGSEARGVFVIGRRRHVISGIDTDTGIIPALKVARLLPDEKFFALHGGFFERLRNMEDLDVKVALSGAEFEHNGVKANLAHHVLLSLADSQELADISAGEDGGALVLVRKVRNRERYISSMGDLGFEFNTSQVEARLNQDGGDALLSHDGKPIAYRKSATEFWKKNYGTLISGEKTGQQRLIDAAAANINQLFFLAEYERGSGYVNNYGLPNWYARLNYAGQSEKNLQAISTDAFERPVVEKDSSGIYHVLDRKTAKEILASDNPDMVREVLLQNSKYLGSLPYISGFLGEWGPVGGYVMSGYSLGVPLDTIEHEIKESLQKDIGGVYKRDAVMPWTTALTENDISEFTYRPEEGMIGPNERKKVFQRQNKTGTTYITEKQSHTITSRGDKSFRQVPSHSAYMPTGAYVSLLFGLENNDENTKRAFRLMNSNATTIFRFAPNFQTKAQREAFRKKAIAGIPSMMVGDIGESGKPVANPALIDWLSNVASNYEKAGRLKKAIYDIQTEGISRDEAAKKHGTTPLAIQVSESKLRKKGIPIPSQKGGLASRSKAELRVNPDTNKWGVSPRVVQRIVELRQQGYTLREIAKDVGLSNGNTYLWLKRKNLVGTNDRDRNRIPDETE